MPNEEDGVLNWVARKLRPHECERSCTDDHNVTMDDSGDDKTDFQIGCVKTEPVEILVNTCYPGEEANNSQRSGLKSSLLRNGRARTSSHEKTVRWLTNHQNELEGSDVSDLDDVVVTGGSMEQEYLEELATDSGGEGDASHGLLRIDVDDPLHREWLESEDMENIDDHDNSIHPLALIQAPLAADGELAQSAECEVETDFTFTTSAGMENQGLGASYTTSAGIENQGLGASYGQDNMARLYQTESDNESSTISVFDEKSVTSSTVTCTSEKSPVWTDEEMYRKVVSDEICDCLHCRKNKSKNIPGVPFKCSHCGAEFKFYHSLVVHQCQRTEGLHGKCSLLECRDCCESFTTEVCLKKHEQKHTGILCNRPFVCSVCEKAFSYEVWLSKHMLTHLDELGMQSDGTIRTEMNLSQNSTVDVIHEPNGKKSSQKKVNLKGEHESSGYFHEQYTLLRNSKEVSRERRMVEPKNSHGEMHSSITESVDTCETESCPSDDQVNGSAKTAVHVCAICEKCFLLKSSLEQHRFSHGDDNYLRSDTSFSTQTSPSDHEVDNVFKNGQHSSAVEVPKPEKLTKNVGSSTCKRVRFESVSEKSFESNSDETDLKLPLKSSESSMFIEQGKMPNLKPFACSQCSQTFVKKVSLQNHEQIHANSNQVFSDGFYPCKQCDKFYTMLKSLRKHEFIHGERKFKCQFCNLSFMKKYSLRSHEKVHSSERPFHCSLCDKSFVDKEKLTRHKMTHEKLFICSYCGDSFSDRRGLTVHERIHTGDKPYKCHVCSSAFRSWNNLRVHMFKHNGKGRRCLCEVPGCDKGFPNASALRRHSLTHSCEKPYACELCEKTFLWPDSLARHMATHSNDKPYKCQFCDKGFTQKGNCKIHERTHTGEKPFDCEFCGERFRVKCLMKYHTCPAAKN